MKNNSNILPNLINLRLDVQTGAAENFLLRTYRTMTGWVPNSINASPPYAHILRLQRLM